MSRSRARALIRKLLAAEAVGPNCEISLVLCGDDEIRRLNRDYRGLDEPTDVLSFPQEVETPLPGERRLLGDVVISVPTARRQAEAAAHPLERELEWLLLHGVLHLLGYDDSTPEGLQEMIDKQRAVQALADSGSASPPRRDGGPPT